MNSVFLSDFAPFSTNLAGVFGGANIVEGRQADDTLVASTTKDIFFYQTAPTSGSGYLINTEIGADTIHGFTIGEDAIVLTDLYSNTDHIGFGSTAAALKWSVAARVANWVAGSNGWVWTAGASGAGDLTYTSPNASTENVTIHLVGINGTVTDVNSFFFSGVA